MTGGGFYAAPQTWTDAKRLAHTIQRDLLERALAESDTKAEAARKVNMRPGTFIDACKRLGVEA